MQMIEIAAMVLALLLGICVLAAAGDNSRQGQNAWCWQSESSTVMYCDYSTYGSCQSANRGKEHGACVHQ
jgi:hypothetical protein